MKISPSSRVCYEDDCNNPAFVVQGIGFITCLDHATTEEVFMLWAVATAPLSEKLFPKRVKP